MISVTLNSVQQTTPNVCALRELVDLAGMNSTLQAHWAHGSVTVHIMHVCIYEYFSPPSQFFSICTNVVLLN